MPRTIEELLAAARASIRRYEPAEALAAASGGAVIVDIRSSDVRARDGIVLGSLHVPRTVLEWRLDPQSDHRIPQISGYDTRIVVVCNEGYSSSLAAATLQDLGLHQATDMIGGYQAWLAINSERR